MPFRISNGVLLEHLAHQVSGLAFLARGQRSLVIVNVLRGNHDINGLGMVQLLELLRGELGLRRAAAAEDAHGLGLVLGQGIVDIIGDFGHLELVTSLGQDAGDIKAHVTHADDCDLCGGKIPIALEARVAIVEAHELAGTMHAVEVRAGDIAVAVAHGAGGKDHGIIMLLQLIDGDIPADVHVGQQANLLRIEYAVEGFNDAFNARMVRCYAVTDEAKGGGHLLNEVNLYLTTGLFYQDVGGIDAGWTGTDHGYF